MDDGIVVDEVEKGVYQIGPTVRALREKLGDDAMSDLHILLDDAGRQWKDDVLTLAGERFERRLSEEIGALRVDMAKEFAAVRVEIIKWSFLFWIGQVATVGGMLAFFLRG